MLPLSLAGYQEDQIRLPIGLPQPDTRIKCKKRPRPGERTQQATLRRCSGQALRQSLSRAKSRGSGHRPPGRSSVSKQQCVVRWGRSFVRLGPGGSTEAVSITISVPQTCPACQEYLGDSRNTRWADQPYRVFPPSGVLITTRAPRNPRRSASAPSLRQGRLPLRSV